MLTPSPFPYRSSVRGGRKRNLLQSRRKLGTAERIDHHADDQHRETDAYARAIPEHDPTPNRLHAAQMPGALRPGMNSVELP